MKRGNWASGAAGQVAKRLPIGGRKKGLGKVVGNLPLPKSIPGGKTTGTAGGLLLGAGAAVAANQVLKRGRNGNDNDNQGEENEETQGKSTSSSGSRSSGTKAAEKKRDEVSASIKDGGDSKDDKKDKKKDQEGKDKKGGFFGGIKNTLGKVFKRGGGGGGSKKLKMTNIVEYTDVGAPRRLVYDQFTQFQEFPSFMKKVESVDQASDEKLNWKAKIFWSARTWEATIVEQLPDKHVVWRSKAPKGHVDGTVSFHELAPNLTRVLVNLEYHPQGLFERTGNLWRAQGRRVRLELKHFRRHVMTQSLVKADEIEGWRGEIRDSEVVKTHEDAVAEEEKAGGSDDKKQTSSSRKPEAKKNDTKKTEKEYESAR
ncbi:SRPBCC family protein [Actinomadura hibisca]|uniref:SRPBCC family protein n=1 Tax=Actinomadura hibisca TaxID=68565 RepID=UPI000A065C6A|nr:SRPBCC family protein [Actinomadura hibisca]